MKHQGRRMSTIASTMRTTAPWTARRSPCTVAFGYFLPTLLLSYLWCSEALAYTSLSFIWYVTPDSLSHTVTHSLPCVTSRRHAPEWFRQGSRNLIAFINWIGKKKPKLMYSIKKQVWRSCDSTCLLPSTCWLRFQYFMTWLKTA